LEVVDTALEVGSIRIASCVKVSRSSMVTSLERWRWNWVCIFL
jgi:hypothetical protein